MNLKFFTLSLLLAAVVYSASSQTIVYVNKNATGIPIDGTTWSRAYRDLGQALTASTTISGNVQIWVAAGVYYPTTTTNRSISFQISRANLTVSGGFAGTETNFSQRNFAANEVVLSGNIGSTGTNADNSLQVVQVNNAAVNATTYLTGLRISDANSTTTGGGLVVSAGFLSISDCKFSDNNTSEHGAGLFLGGLQGLSNQNIIDRCVFYDNYANRYGGGAMISVGRSAKFTNCLFYNNDFSTTIIFNITVINFIYYYIMGTVIIICINIININIFIFYLPKIQKLKFKFLSRKKDYILCTNHF